MRNFTPTRRTMMLGTLATSLAVALPRAIAQHAPDLSTLKPGQFIWTPERAPAGPVVVLVSIPDVIRNREQVLQQAVNGDAMPLGNETGMTTAERAALGAFLAEH